MRTWDDIRKNVPFVPIVKTDPDPHASNSSLFRTPKKPYNALYYWVLNPSVPPESGFRRWAKDLLIRTKEIF
jgi:hypothetical protein